MSDNQRERARQVRELQSLARESHLYSALPPAFEPVLPPPDRIDFDDVKLAIFADTLTEQMVEQIVEFQNSLAADEEVGACLAYFGQTVVIAVEAISSRHPHLLIFEGVVNEGPAKGSKVRLLQHMSQANVLLIRLKVTEPRAAHRIGFRTDEPR